MGMGERLDDGDGPLEHYGTHTEAQQRWDAARDSCTSQQSSSNETTSLARTHHCSGCLQPKGKHQYSKSQWQKKSKRKCQECVQQVLELAGGASTARRKNLRPSTTAVPSLQSPSLPSPRPANEKVSLLSSSKNTSKTTTPNVIRNSHNDTLRSHSRTSKGVEKRLDDGEGPFDFEEFLEYYESEVDAQQRWNAAGKQRPLCKSRDCKQLNVDSCLGRRGNTSKACKVSSKSDWIWTQQKIL